MVRKKWGGNLEIKIDLRDINVVYGFFGFLLLNDILDLIIKWYLWDN